MSDEVTDAEASGEPEVLDAAAVEDEEAGPGPLTYSITSYGADYPVDGLIKRIRSGDIYIPGFQRHYVWKAPQASRFIESLLLGLPVPGLFLSRDDDSNRLLVIDGQQRLLTLRRFYDGEFEGKSFKLKGVDPALEGKTYKTLTEDERRKLDDSVLHLTIIRQDSPVDDRTSIYHIFERLNTGGTPLTPQEIRGAIFYRSPLMELLNDLNILPAWRSIIGRESAKAKDKELILRFLALSSALDEYSAPMKGFLNRFMAQRTHAHDLVLLSLRKSFIDTIEAVGRCLQARAFKPERVFNAAVFDAVMVAIARRVQARPISDCAALRAAYERLLNEPEFVRAYKTSTSDPANVRERIALATAAFADIQ